MLPLEKALVERLKNEPFALIGINTDSNLATVKSQSKSQGIAWRNAWEGALRPGAGPLCKAWGIVRFPTIYVLDGRGVVRYVDPSGEALEKAVDTLLAEMKAEKKKDGGKR